MSKPEAASGDEIFEIFNDQNILIGRESRKNVHQQGLFHRSVSIWLINDKKEILIQKRIQTKIICPTCWDASAAEHLQPGESYLQAAVRGIQEELSISLHPQQIGRFSQLIPTNLFVYSAPNILDKEFQETWWLPYNGSFAVDGTEVEEAKWVPLSKLANSDLEATTSWTPWFIKDINWCRENNIFTKVFQIEQ